jgi:hypothetical protein
VFSTNGRPYLKQLEVLSGSFRNDALPRIAVTVDLLSTGIDIPKITNLVFVRRVNSRIYELRETKRQCRRSAQNRCATAQGAHTRAASPAPSRDCIPPVSTVLRERN